MFKSLQQSWRHFKHAPPGKRFILHYREHQAGSRSKAASVVYVLLGVVLVVAGLIQLVVPGPGILVVALGAALVAQESEKASRALDRFELWVRTQVDRFRQWWKRASLPTRIVLVLLSSIVAFAAAAAFGYFFLRKLWQG